MDVNTKQTFLCKAKAKHKMLEVGLWLITISIFPILIPPPIIGGQQFQSHEYICILWKQSNRWCRCFFFYTAFFWTKDLDDNKNCKCKKSHIKNHSGFHKLQWIFLWWITKQNDSFSMNALFYLSYCEIYSFQLIYFWILCASSFSKYCGSVKEVTSLVIK